LPAASAAVKCSQCRCRRGDQDRIDALVFQQVTVVEIRLRIRRNLLHIVEAARVDVGGPDAFHVLAGHRFAQDLRPARARSDDADADASVRAQDVGRGEGAS